jgi:hypothetical protein
MLNGTQICSFFITFFFASVLRVKACTAKFLATSSERILPLVGKNYTYLDIYIIIFNIPGETIR